MKEKKKKEDLTEERCCCGEKCTCGDDCNCTEEHCCCEHHSCKCEDHCCCDDECDCGEHCECGDECDCDDSDCCGHHHHDEDCCCDHSQDLAIQYLSMAQRLQADFDNYRKRVAEQLDLQREEGKKSVIEVFLPCLDTFKEAKKSINDETVLSGVNMIENKILSALASLKVEKIEAVGQKFDHNLHEVIAVMNNSNFDEDIILDEFQAGYKFNGKVIRYSKVIVNKKGE